MEASQAGQTDEGAQDQHVSEDATTKEQNVIVGDSGLQPLSQLAQVDPNRVGPTSAPPPDAQSGVPLPEDKAAGVQPNEEFRGSPEGRTPEGAPVEPPPPGQAVEQDPAQR